MNHKAVNNNLVHHLTQVYHLIKPVTKWYEDTSNKTGLCRTRYSSEPQQY